MKITSKGQVTIPAKLRERMGFLPGSEVRFILDGDTLRMVKEAFTMGWDRDWVECLRGKATVATTTAEILAITRGK